MIVTFAVSPVSAKDPPPGGSDWAKPDLKAASLEFSLLQRYDVLGTKGRVRIRGVVTNCKGGVYYGTAHATLWAQVGGQWNLVHGTKIPPLSTGAVSDVVHDLDWDKNAPAAAAYKLVVELAQGDGWNASDNPSNNVLIRSSSELSALLHPTMQNKASSSPSGAGPKVNWPKSGSPWEKFRRAK
jgi:hypothetical protein